MKIDVLKSKNERERATRDMPVVIDHYYTRGTVYVCILGHGIFEAWKPIKKVGKFLSLYTGKEVSLEGKSHVSVKTEDDGPGKNEMFFRDPKLQGYEVYCKKLEAKGIKLPEEPLSEEDERKYIGCMHRMSGNQSLLEQDTKQNLEAVLAPVVLNRA